MKELDIRDLKYFSVLAKELHFGKAATKLNITQPSLSQRIGALELFLNVTLFQRDRRKVILTPAGQFLADKSFAVIQQVEGIVKEVKAFEERTKNEIIVGLVEIAELNVLAQAIKETLKLYPNVKFPHVDINVDLQINALLEKKIDVGFGLCPKQNPDFKKVSHKILIKGTWVAIMDKDHPLSQKKVVKLKDLKDEKLIVLAKDVNPAFYNKTVSLFRKNKIVLNIVYETKHPRLGMQMVKNGVGIMLGANFYMHDVDPGVVIKPLEGLQDYHMGVYWRKDEESGLILDFIEFLIEKSEKKVSELRKF